MTKLPRRRFLAITAAAFCLPSLAHAARPLSVRWRGRTMGAEAEIVLEHPDAQAANAALADCLAEVERLEAVFSLHRDSALARLNRDGALEMPPLDLVRALEEAAAISNASDGAFDATVQPLWQAHAQALAATGQPPSPAVLAVARQLVGWRNLHIDSRRIAFARPGMAVTLNGLAQGYISDRVSELLTRRGFANVLVDLGEIRALGPHADGQSWQVAVRDPVRHERAMGQVGLSGGAMATTEAFGSSFADTGTFGHLVDPISGVPALGMPSVTVRAPTATLADGLSTALAVAGSQRARSILAHFSGTSALVQSPGGTLVEL